MTKAWFSLILDLRTIYVVGATTTLILGSMQLVAYTSGRFERWPLWWGLSNLLFGLGIMLAAFRGHVPDELSIVIANILLLSANMLLHASLRQFGGRTAPPRPYAAVLLATAALMNFWIDAENFPYRVALMSFLLAACDVFIVRECLRLAREQRLSTGWILAALFVPSALALAMRGVSGLAGGMGLELFPPEGARDVWLNVLAVALLIIRSSAFFLLATERARQQFIALAREDALTGAMNRTGLAAAVAELMIPSAARAVRRDALLMLDIDHFKALNDRHGHAAGDRVLQLLTETARRHLRPEDLIARQGGDEFTVLLPNIGRQEALAVAERIRSAFAEQIGALDVETPITISIGVTEGDLGRDPFDALLQEADEALYRAKRIGRNRIEAALPAAV